MIKLLARIAGRFGLNPKEAERFVKFLMVGTLGFIIDFGVLTFLVEVAGFLPVVANTISFSLAVLSNFTWNRYWTYPESRSKRKRIQLIQFAVVSILGLIINNLILVLLQGPFNALFDLPFFSFLPEDIGYIPAKMVATVAVLFWNFFINRYWTYSNVARGISEPETVELEDVPAGDARQITVHR